MKLAIWALMGLVAATPALAQVKVTTRTIISKSKTREIKVRYPHTGRPDLDRLFADFARNYAANVEPNELDAGDLESPQGPNKGWMDFKIRRNDARIFGIEVWTSDYSAGAAHPQPNLTTYNFLMPEGRAIGLSDLVEGKRGLERVRDLAKVDLDRQLESPGYVHLKAHENYFSDFIWQPNELELIFPPYSVAGYAQGTLTVHIPFAKLADVIRPDPRVPAASFDCARARSPIEKAICSDADLARLDRRVAERYADAYDNHRDVPPFKINETSSEKQTREVAQGYHDKTIAWQRAWLARRDHDCTAASVACLKTSYDARLKSQF